VTLAVPSRAKGILRSKNCVMTVVCFAISAPDLECWFTCVSKSKCGPKSELQISPGAVTRAGAGQDEKSYVAPNAPLARLATKIKSGDSVSIY
jgi:hypothetical protein